MAVAEICVDHPATTGGTVQFFAIPTFPSIPGVLELAQPAGIAVGGQDLHWEDVGPFTGEVSGAELAELGCTMVEIGHAERRAMFGETDEIVARKTLAGLRNGLAPVLCIGEPEPGATGRGGRALHRAARVGTRARPARRGRAGSWWWPTSRTGPSALRNPLRRSTSPPSAVRCVSTSRATSCSRTRR